FLRVLDAAIKRVTPVEALKPVAKKVFEPRPVEQEVVAPEKETPLSLRRIGVVFHFHDEGYPGFAVDAVVGESQEEGTAFVGKVEKLELNKFISPEGYSERDQQLIPVLRKMHESEVAKYLNRNSPFSGIWENIIHHEEDDLPEDTKNLMVDYLHPKLKKLLPEIANNALVYYVKGKKSYKTEHLRTIGIALEPIVPYFRVTPQKNGVELVCRVRLNGQEVALTDNEIDSSLLFFYEENLYSWQRPEDVAQVMKFHAKGKRSFSRADWPQQLTEQVIPLAQQYGIEFHPELISSVKDGDPEKRIVLQEKGEYLVFQPHFSYKGFETKAGGKDQLVIPDGEKIMLVNRDREKEHQFLNKLELLHSNFIRTGEGHELALKGSEVLKNNWFFLFVDAMREQKVPVFGHEALKNFRFNTAKPSTRIHISSNTDWFDARVEIQFGDQKITVEDVKKALANRQQFVPLQDGTLGILPEDWIKKYSLLFRVGEGKQHQLKLSKYHLSVIDELYANRDEEELELKLEERYEQLRSFHKIKEITVPVHLEKVLRPYQEHGYHWLNYLAEVGWGGILADDMGLGKTVQALSYLHYIRQQQGKLSALVVCPTTLMFNWENEIKKFTPELTYHIHHGGDRSRMKDTLSTSSIVITTYGTLRSDITMLADLAFDFVILDESQAIKNPTSKVTRAACLLQAKHRLCMSGTPLQNNTFDIFAQMNFLSPGMLGSMEFF
ncbi:MAG: DEAD/DEAH box helicase, partial [Chitinophagaceae bacterium]